MNNLYNQGENMSFKAKCPKCEISYEAEDEWLGMEAECPECGQQIKIEKDLASVSEVSSPIETVPEEMGTIETSVSTPPSANEEIIPESIHEATTEQTPKQKNKSKKGLIIVSGLILALVLLGGGAVGFFMMSKKNNSSQRPITRGNANQKKKEATVKKDILAFLKKYETQIAVSLDTFFKDKTKENMVAVHMLMSDARKDLKPLQIAVRQKNDTKLEKAFNNYVNGLHNSGGQLGGIFENTKQVTENKKLWKDAKTKKEKAKYNNKMILAKRYLEQSMKIYESSNKQRQDAAKQLEKICSSWL